MGGSVFFYLGALILYVFSFISGFSVGLYVFFCVVLFFLLGLAKTFGFLNKNVHYLVITIASFAIWYLLVRYIDDAYLFYPFTLLL
jgi:hypothetical protein